jgi:hypothetical protein
VARRACIPGVILAPASYAEAAGHRPPSTEPTEAAGHSPLKERPVEKLKSQDFSSPAILLGGPVDYDMYKNFRSQLDDSKKEGLVVTELSTLGGDPEVARMMGEDIRFHSENSKNCRFVFLGKAAIYPLGPHL